MRGMRRVRGVRRVRGMSPRSHRVQCMQRQCEKRLCETVGGPTERPTCTWFADHGRTRGRRQLAKACLRSDSRYRQPDRNEEFSPKDLQPAPQRTANAREESSDTTKALTSLPARKSGVGASWGRSALPAQCCKHAECQADAEGHEERDTRNREQDRCEHKEYE